jgi:hypothetical protein
VIFVAELPTVAGLGETVHVDSEGAPVQVKVTAWLNPPSPPTLKVYVVDCPGEAVCDDEEPEGIASVKSSPVPLMLTACVLPSTSLLLSVMVRVPVRVPLPPGVKVTLNVQLAPPATLSPQVLVWAKSPLTATLLMLSGAPPVFFNVTACGKLVVPTSCLPKTMIVV